VDRVGAQPAKKSKICEERNLRHTVELACGREIMPRQVAQTSTRPGIAPLLFGGRKKTRFRKVQPVMAFASTHLDEDLSLGALAKKAHLSAFHLHRLFSAAADETPKQFALRLRLSRAAVMLLTSKDSVLNVALECGFESHGAFTRAFRQCFRITPTSYRKRGFATDVSGLQAAIHKELVSTIGLCLRLFHRSEDSRSTRNLMTYAITKKELLPQPTLVLRRRVKRAEIAATLAQSFGTIFQYAQRTGSVLAGQPFTRFLEWGPGILTIEAGLPVAARANGEGEITAETLPGGPAATTMHLGPYEGLAEAHAAIQVWIEEQGLSARGKPWETYVTDPADYPDPKDWRTEVFWPLAH
jgi:AraC family transcriptional regulator